MTEQTSHAPERPTTTEDTDRGRRRPRPVRLPHEPERLPHRAERFLGLLDRSRRG